MDQAQGVRLADLARLQTRDWLSERPRRATPPTSTLSSGWQTLAEARGMAACSGRSRSLKVPRCWNPPRQLFSVCPSQSTLPHLARTNRSSSKAPKDFRKRTFTRSGRYPCEATIHSGHRTARNCRLTATYAAICRSSTTNYRGAQGTRVAATRVP